MKRPMLDRGRLAIGDMRLRITLRELMTTAGIVGASSAAAFLVKPMNGEASEALIFVLGIMLCGAFEGLTAALIAAIAGFLIYNFYFAEPVLAFRLARGSDIAPLLVFNLCAVISGVLAGRLKDSVQAANRKNEALSRLLEMSQALQSAVRLGDVAAALRATPSARSGVSLHLFSIKNGRLQPLMDGAAQPEWQAMAERSLQSVDPIRCEDGLTAHRLDGSDGPLGVFVFKADAVTRLEPPFMAALANLFTLAMERATLSEMIEDVRALAKTEELKTALLSSVSHDFRTPLTAISASASSLIDYREQLDRDVSLRLLQGIVDDCERLNRYTANLLEMSRLEAGALPTNLQKIDVIEMLVAVMQRVRPRLNERRMTRLFTGTDIVVLADASLFELVLVNVLDNAILYSERKSCIHIEVEDDGGYCRITIADEGRGIPDEDLERVFDRFHRVARTEPSPLGSGLGLAIAKAFVGALGGSIAAMTPGIGLAGTRIVICLPLVKEDRPQ
ncbi:sensor histidine kinase [Sphingomonas glacialis]|uniref:histidine kinase n=1 Tax=Sphingomonas glacialis TaxID=658225 RepID=A0A502FF36_9SPHN|nr:ATP-binding protein [Sphingomonas glacialis]TPG48030.1 DUF4118 domain-containing protein [Sphingomonas glacialis]